MSDRQLLLFVVWILPIIYSVTRPYSVVDVAGWVAHGQYFLSHLEILRKDVFSILPTEPLVYPAWAVSILYAVVERATSLLWLCVLHACALMWVFAYLYKESIAATRSPWSRYWVLLICASWFGSFPIMYPRPSELALIPFCLAFVWISRVDSFEKMDARLIFKLSLLGVFWVNLHGSFVLLPLMLGWKVFFLALSRSRGVLRGGVALLAVSLSALVNPFFYSIYPFVFETALKSHQRNLDEWQNTTPWAHFPLGPLFYALLVVTFVLVMKKFREQSAPKISRASLFAWLSSPYFLLLLNGFSGVRNASLVFVVLLPSFRHLGWLKPGPVELPNWERKNTWNWVKTLPFVAVFLLVLPFWREKIMNSPPMVKAFPHSWKKPFGADVIPEIAGKIRESGKSCPVFNRWEVGSYLMISIPNKIYIDSRNILYSAEEMDSYRKTRKGEPGWDQFLDQYGACFAVIAPLYDQGLIDRFQADGRWQEVHSENGFQLWARR